MTWGVKIHCNQPVDADVLARLQSEYDAVFMGVGLGRSLGLDIPGNSRMADGLALLEAVQNGERPDIDGEVAVVGGGNTAVDVAPLTGSPGRPSDDPLPPETTGHAGLRTRD